MQAQTVTLDPDVGRDVAAEVLLHELLHAMFWVTDLDSLLDEHEETTAARLAFVLLDVLRSNPKLVDYLLDLSHRTRSTT